MSRARDLAALVTPNLFNQNAGRDQVGLGTSSIGAKIQVGGAVSATTYYGDGSNLTGIALSAASSQQITNLNVTGITTLNQVFISAGGTVFGGDFNNTTFTGVTSFSQVSAGGSVGQDGQVLVSNGSGVEWRDPVGVRTEVFITAGIGSTQFNFQHDPNDLDVFLNGIKLEPTEYTSDGGTVVSLAASTRAGDIVNLVGYGVSGYVGQQGSLTVRGNGTNVGNVGGIRIIDFRGQDISVTGSGTSVSVNIPPRQGIIDTRNTRAYVSHDNVGASQTQFSFLGIASSDTYDNIDVFVNGFKQYVDEVNFNNPKYIGLTSAAPTGGDVIGIGYASNGVRTGIASTAVEDQVVFLFSGTGIGTPGRVNSGRPIDVYYRGIKLVEGETYFKTFGDAIILNAGVNVFKSDIIDIFSYVDQAKTGIATLTATEETDIIALPSPTTSTSVDLVINGVKQPYLQNVGLSSVVLLTEAPNPVGASVIINSYVSGAKLGIRTETVGAGETIHFGTLNDEHFVNGLKLAGADIDSVGVTSIASLRNVPEVGSIIENIRYAPEARTGIATITATSIGQTVFADTSVTFSENNVDVFFNGVKLTSSEFSIVGTSSTVTLTNGADSVGDILEVIRWNLGARYGITTFTAGLGQTDFTVGIPTAVPDNDVYINGVKLDSGGASPEFVVQNGISIGAGVTIQLAVGAEAGDIIEIVGINTDARVTNREVATATPSGFYVFDIDEDTGDQETFVNGVRVLGAEREAYAPNEYIFITGGAVGGSVFETFRYADYARVGVSTFIAPPARSLTTQVSAPGVGIGSTQIILDSVSNVAVGDSIIITGAGATFASGVTVVSVGATSVFIGIGQTLSTTIAAGLAATVTSGIGSTTVVVSAPNGVPDNDVYINGVVQDPSSDYSVYYTATGITTIGFATHLAINDIVEVVGIATTARVVNTHTSTLNENVYEVGYYNGENEIFINGIRQQQTGITSTYNASQYVVLESEGQNLTVNDEVEIFEYASWARVGVTTFEATEGQTTFTVGIPTGVPDNDVFVNGVRLAPSSFTVIGGGATISLAQSAAAGSYVEVVGIATTARSGIRTEYSAAIDGQSIIPVDDASGNIEIYVNGIRYSNSQFTVDADDNDLRIDVNPSSANPEAKAGDHLEVIEYNSDLSQLGRTSASYRAFAGQTEFQVAYDDIKLLDVFVNGLLLSPSEYTAETGSNIILNNALAEDDLVELISYAGTNVADWIKTSVGIYNTSRYVGVGTTATNYQLEVGYPGIAGTTLWVHGDARVTGILSVGQGTIAIDGNKNEIRVGAGLVINSTSGIVTATSFVGNLTGTATTAQGLTTSASVDTTGIITATTFYGNLVGNVTGQADTVLGIGTTASINTSGIITATKLRAGVGSFGDAVFGGFGYAGIITARRLFGNVTGDVTGTATGLTTTASINTVGIITASSFVGALTGNVTGTATTATTALALSTDVNINTTGIVTAGTFAGNLTGTASTATLALGFSTTASINTSGIITASTFSGSLIGNVQGTASISQVALALTTTADATINSLVVSGVSTFQSNVSLGDNDKILLGNDGDFEITFDSSNAIFQNKSGNTGGDLYVRSDVILLQKYDGTETIAEFTEGAGVELNWVGVTKFATSNTGASVFGDLSVSGSVTASQFNGLATGLTTVTSLNLTGIITAAAFVSDGDVSLIGDNNILGIGTGYRVGVGTLTPAADAILDLKSTTQVFLPPRMTAAQRNSIGSTSTGAIIFNTDSGRHQGYDGSAWNDFYL